MKIGEKICKKCGSLSIQIKELCYKCYHKYANKLRIIKKKEKDKEEKKGLAYCTITKFLMFKGNE